MTPIMHLKGHGSKTTIVICEEEFSLTLKGCRECGAWLFQQGIEEWMCSSDVDFPRERKKGFTYGVRAIVQQGYEDAYKKALRADLGMDLAIDDTETFNGDDLKIIDKLTENKDVVAVIPVTGDEDYDSFVTQRNARLFTSAARMRECLRKLGKAICDKGLEEDFPEVHEAAEILAYIK